MQKADHDRLGSLLTERRSAGILPGLGPIFEFRDRGVRVRRRGLVLAEIDAADLTSVQCGSGRVWWSRWLRHTTLRLETGPEGARTRIRFRTFRDRARRVVFDLAVHYGGILAARWEEDLAAGREIVWTPSLRLTNEAVREIPFPDGTGGRTIPLAETAAFEVAGGRFRIRSRGSDATIEGLASEWNFLPGERVLRRRLRAGE